MTDVQQAVRDRFADAGARGWLHAVGIPTGGGREVDVNADAPVVMASVYKLPLLVCFCRLVDSGEIDPCQQVTVPAEGRTPGPTGLSVLRDPVTMSLRDLAAQMVTLSDNAAADVVLARVGLDRLNEMVAGFGLSGTRVVGGTLDVQRGLTAQTGTSGIAEAFAALASNDDVAEVAAYDPALTSATTPRDMTTLLAALWTDQLASPEQSSFAREVLHAQVWPHRLRAGFPYRRVRVAGKTGTIGAIRNEVGVVTFPGERPVAVAVFTHAARADPVLPRVDAAIGETARLAVTRLRSGRL